MKSTIIILGLAVLSLTTVNAANEFKSQDLDQQEFATVNVDTVQFSCATIENNTTDTAFFNPSSVITTSYVKTVEEVIAENKLITESKEEVTQPLSIATTLEDRIAEDNQIIESDISKEVFPLDFNKINQRATVNNNAIMVTELKL